jgi:ferredoxin
MHISIDRDSCIGSGQCALIAPDVFGQDEMGISYLLQADVSAPRKVLAHEAEVGCPVHAITVAEDRSEEEK